MDTKMDIEIIDINAPEEIMIGLEINREYYKFTFCESGFEYFKNKFWWKDKRVSDCNKEFNPFDKHQKGFGRVACPNCGSKNNTEYPDCFLCFDCFYEEKYRNLSNNYELVIVNGYLARRQKKSDIIEFFHRIVVGAPLAKHVHHKDFDKTNNRISNLKIMWPNEHRRLHDGAIKEKAYHTWCSNSNGCNDGWEEFSEWYDNLP